MFKNLFYLSFVILSILTTSYIEQKATSYLPSYLPSYFFDSQSLTPLSDSSDSLLSCGCRKKKKRKLLVANSIPLYINRQTTT